MCDAVAAKDPRNGNRALHIAAQNGHRPLAAYIISQRADVNAQNGKGQTALHMSVEYDFYFISKMLLAESADADIENCEGHKAISGIEGGKVGNAVWSNPVTILKAAGDNAEELDEAFSKLEQQLREDKTKLEKVELAKAGLLKKKTCLENFSQDRFKAIMAAL